MVTIIAIWLSSSLWYLFQGGYRDPSYKFSNYDLQKSCLISKRTFVISILYYFPNNSCFCAISTGEELIICFKLYIKFRRLTLITIQIPYFIIETFITNKPIFCCKWNIIHEIYILFSETLFSLLLRARILFFQSVTASWSLIFLSLVDCQYDAARWL